MKSHTKISCAAIAFVTLATSAYAASKPEYENALSGYQFGVGVPLMVPLTGYNVFVGYVNKNASTFLGRRFGIRADFNIPCAFKLQGTISGNPNQDGYLADVNGKVMGFDLKLSDFSDKKIEIDAFEDDKGKPITLGQDAADMTLKIKNQNIGLLVDFYPFADTWFLGGLRLTGGYYFGDFDISAKANINKDIEYGYAIDGSNNILRAQVTKGSYIGADLHWKYHGPYAGLGFDLGIFRGFKFFMDAGVVFTDVPKVTENNIHDKDLHLQGRYEIWDGENPYSIGDYVHILDGLATAPNVDKIVQDTVGSVVSTTLNDSRYAAAYSDVIGAIGVGNDLGKDVIDFLNGDGETAPAPWITKLLDNHGGSELAEVIEDIRDEWTKQGEEIKGGIQQDINDAWEDYNKHKHDAIDDINDFLEDYGMFPIVKIGFMYRF